MRRPSWTVHEIRATRRDLVPQGALRMLTRFRVDLPALNTITGTYRRHRTHVPTPDEGGTTMGLGWKQDGLLYPGFGLDTVGHVVVQARGGKQESTAALLANGQLVVQSDDDGMYLFSRAPSVLGSTRVANVLGSGGIVLAAGYPLTIANAAVEGMRPDRPPVDATLPGMMDDVSARWTEWDAAVAAAQGRRDALEASTHPKGAHAWYGDVAKTSVLARAACLAANVPAAAGDSTDGIVVLHGKGGFLVGSPKTGSIEAAEALRIVSKDLVVCAHGNAEIHGGTWVKLSAGSRVHVIAKDDAVLASDDGVTVVASRRRGLLLRAPTLAVGTFTPAAPQEATHRLHVKSTEHISIATNPEREHRAPGIWVDSAQGIDMRAKESIRLDAERDIRARIADDEKMELFMNGPAAQISARAGPSLLLVGAKDGLRMQHAEGTAAGSLLALTSERIDLEVLGSSSQIELKKQEVRIRGSKIRIG